MRLTLVVWRQDAPGSEGRFQRHQLDASREMTLLEALDLLNERLVARGERPVAFESDCREGICGACGLEVNGRPHGGGGTTCQIPLRDFPDPAEIVLAPLRAGRFPVLRDLVVDRSALDRLVIAGGYVTVHAGGAPEASAISVPRATAERALDAAACIGCGACVAACPNGSAALFIGAKLTHLALLPQGQPERRHRALAMTAAADTERFGACSLHGECQEVCPQHIPLAVIARMNREVLQASGPERRWSVMHRRW